MLSNQPAGLGTYEPQDDKRNTTDSWALAGECGVGRSQASHPLGRSQASHPLPIPETEKLRPERTYGLSHPGVWGEDGVQVGGQCLRIGVYRLTCRGPIWHLHFPSFAFLLHLTFIFPPLADKAAKASREAWGQGVASGVSSVGDQGCVLSPLSQTVHLQLCGWIRHHLGFAKRAEAPKISLKPNQKGPQIKARL